MNLLLFKESILMQNVELFIENFLLLTMDASPWLLLGLFIAGLMKYWLPSKILCHHLGQGKLSIIKAAFIGAPLPLCSCGVIPVATELRRSGASKPATAAFLVATPETGIDSISVSYAMLGPVFAIFRPIAAISSAIVTGVFVSFDDAASIKNETQDKANQIQSIPPSSCCADKIAKSNKDKKNCCSSSLQKTLYPLAKSLKGIQYASTRLIDDLIIWLVIGLLFATLVKTFIPMAWLTYYGSGLPAMLVMIILSIPMYICATASTPIAAGLLLAGISPGTALVFMLAGPATNISTLGVIRKELGASTLYRYLSGVIISALFLGYLLDYVVTYWAIDVNQHMQHGHELVPSFIAVGSSLLLLFLAIKPLRELFFETLH